MSEKKKTSCLGLGCGGIIVVVGIIGVMAVISPKSEDKSNESANEAGSTSEQSKPNCESGAQKSIQDAYYASRRFVQNSLKAPSTAKFSNIITDTETTGASMDGSDRIKCWGIVEAQNEFGVPLKHSWATVVQEEGNQWRVVYARLGDQVLLEARESHKTEKIIRAEEFIGMSYQRMIELMGQPLEVTANSNAQDGGFKIYSYSKDKGKETYFTIWDSDGVIDNGMYQGTYFHKK